MAVLTTLETIARFAALLAFVQGVEFLLLAKATGFRGVWRWNDLEADICGNNGLLKQISRFFLRDEHFYHFNIFRVVIAAWAFLAPNPFALAILLFIHVLTLLRWLGSVNGGSDYMNSIVLLFAGIGLAFPEATANVCLWYIALQACLSYFRAGWIKLKNKNWRSGLAVREFLNSANYEQRRMINEATKSPVFNRVASWSVIAFEVSFPVVLLNQNIAVLYLLVGFFFHLTNAYIFGLNRFVLAWMATYPALYFCSLRLA